MSIWRIYPKSIKISRHLQNTGEQAHTEHRIKETDRDNSLS